MPWELTTNDEG